MYRAPAILIAIALAQPAAAAPAQAVADRPAQVKATGDAALQAWRRSLATGDWKPFMAMLSPTVNIWYPGSTSDVSRFMGTEGRRWLHSRQQAETYFTRLSAAYGNSLRVADVIARSSGGYTVAYELRVEGVRSDGRAYADRIALSFDICGENICSYRQYYGSDGISS